MPVPKKSVIAGAVSLALAAAGTAALVTPAAAVDLTSNVVISEVYGGGGNSGAPYTNDFIELYNHGTADADVSSWSVQYASSTGTSWQVTKLTGTVPAGGYYLIQEGASVSAGPSTDRPPRTSATATV